LFLGRWGIGRINRMVLGGQSAPADVKEAMTVLMTHFKPRIGALPIFSDSELRQLSIPVQLVMGGRDPLRDAERIAAWMKALVPHLTTTIIPEAGHALVGARTYVLPFLERRTAG
jgi:pimeloyl-ACP methyl ester carboxylesterase